MQCSYFEAPASDAHRPHTTPAQLIAMDSGERRLVLKLPLTESLTLSRHCLLYTSPSPRDRG
eukprot:1529091-Amphidinium_carterae.1